MEEKTPEPFDSDTGFVVVAAVRYALTRASYAVSLVADYVWLHWCRLIENDKHVIERDIQEALYSKGAFRFCGQDMDRRVWEALLEKIVEARGSVRSEHASDTRGVGGSNPPEPTIVEESCKRCQDTGCVGDHHGGWKPCPVCQRMIPEPTKVEEPCKRCQGTGIITEMTPLGPHPEHVSMDRKPCPVCQCTIPEQSLAERIVEAVEYNQVDERHDVYDVIKAVERILERG